MLEIFLILGASRHIASMMKQKGRSPVAFVALFVVLWFGGEILGAIAGVALMTPQRGQPTESFKVGAYLCALLGAVMGGAIGYLVAFAVPSLVENDISGGDADVVPAILIEDLPDSGLNAIQAKAGRVSMGDSRRDDFERSRPRRRSPEPGVPAGVWIGIGVGSVILVLFFVGLAGFVFFRPEPRLEVAPPEMAHEDLRIEDPPIAVAPKKIGELPQGALAALPLPENAGEIVALAYSDDGKMLTVATNQERVFWFDAQSRKLFTQSVVRPREVHGHRFSGAAISPSGDRVAFFGHGGLLYLVDRNFLAMDMIINPVGAAGTAQWKAAFSPDGKRLCTTHGDRLARVWTIDRRELLFSLGGFDQQVGSVAYSADSSMLACADDDILIFDGKTEALRTTIRGPQPFFFHALAFSPDGKAIAGLHDRSVHRFALEVNGDKVDAKGKAKLAHHRGRPTSLAYSPDGSLLLSTCDEGILHVWDAKSLQLRTQKTVGRPATAVAVRASDSQVAVGAGGRVILYERQALAD
jgi:hypothetical protein